MSSINVQLIYSRAIGFGLGYTIFISMKSNFISSRTCSVVLPVEENGGAVDGGLEAPALEEIEPVLLGDGAVALERALPEVHLAVGTDVERAAVVALAVEEARQRHAQRQRARPRQAHAQHLEPGGGPHRQPRDLRRGVTAVRQLFSYTVGMPKITAYSNS